MFRSFRVLAVGRRLLLAGLSSCALTEAVTLTVTRFLRHCDAGFSLDPSIMWIVSEVVQLPGILHACGGFTEGNTVDVIREVKRLCTVAPRNSGRPRALRNELNRGW